MGVVVQNVGTAKAVWDAVSQGRPLIERAVTVSGTGIPDPKNLIGKSGNPLPRCHRFLRRGQRRRQYSDHGRPHDGTLPNGPQKSLSSRGHPGILAWSESKPARERACISCARCVAHCPMGLVPTQMMKYIKYDFLNEAEAWGALDCVECGSCQYSCPAKIPLVHWIRLGKNQIIASKRKKSA